MTAINRYDAILFDFDGVLADTEPVHFASWREVLLPFGIDLTWQIYLDSCVGVADQEMLNFLRTLATPIVELDILWAEYPKKKELFRRMVVDKLPIQADTVELVKSLKGYKLAVVSSSGRSEIEPMLRRAGILDCFEALVFGDDVTQFKPHPEPYLMAAERLSAAKPLVVEDSDAGAASGIAAGFDVLKLDDASTLRARLTSHML